MIRNKNKIITRTRNPNLLKLSELNVKDEVKIPKSMCSKYSLSKIVNSNNGLINMHETSSKYVIRKLIPMTKIEVHMR